MASSSSAFMAVLSPFSQPLFILSAYLTPFLLLAFSAFFCRHGRRSKLDSTTKNHLLSSSSSSSSSPSPRRQDLPKLSAEEKEEQTHQSLPPQQADTPPCSPNPNPNPNPNFLFQTKAPQALLTAGLNLKRRIQRKRKNQQVKIQAINPSCSLRAQGQVVRLWDEVKHLPLKTLQFAFDMVASIATHENSDLAVIGEANGRLSLWDLAKTQCVNSFSDSNCFIDSLTMASCGPKSFAGVSHLENMACSVALWDSRVGDKVVGRSRVLDVGFHGFEFRDYGVYLEEDEKSKLVSDMRMMENSLLEEDARSHKETTIQAHDKTWWEKDAILLNKDQNDDDYDDAHDVDDDDDGDFIHKVYGGTDNEDDECDNEDDECCEGWEWSPSPKWIDNGVKEMPIISRCVSAICNVASTIAHLKRD